MPRSRIESIDIVRGLAMVFMALDHVRDYVSNAHFNPQNLERATAALFATRWVTHFCAPAFFLLAGVGMGISHSRGAPTRKVSWFLFSRGIWLIVLDLVITPVLWQFGWPPIPALAIVLWGLGGAMILLAGLVYLPWQAVLAISLGVIFGHNLLDHVSVADAGPLWTLVHGPGFLVPGWIFVVYPPVTWGAVMWLGYVMARLYQQDESKRRRFLVVAGSAAVFLFLVLRWTNGYGDPNPWTAQRSPAMTVASFLNLTKQPPSLQFLLMTLGPISILLALTETARGWFARFLQVYGRAPLFFFVLHIVVAHLVALPLVRIQVGHWARVPVLTGIETLPDSYGVGLLGVYALWIFVVLLLYYPCKKWGELKETRNDWWLRYL